MEVCKRIQMYIQYSFIFTLVGYWMKVHITLWRWHFKADKDVFTLFESHNSLFRRNFKLKIYSPVSYQMRILFCRPVIRSTVQSTVIYLQYWTSTLALNHNLLSVNILFPCPSLSQLKYLFSRVRVDLPA